MTIDFLEYLKETFENANSLNPERVRGLYRESHLFFSSLGEMVQSGGSQATEQALNLLMEVKQFLDLRAQQIEAPAAFILSEEEAAMVAELEESLNISEKVKKSKKIKPKNMS